MKKVLIANHGLILGCALKTLAELEDGTTVSKQPEETVMEYTNPYPDAWLHKEPPRDKKGKLLENPKSKYHK